MRKPEPLVEAVYTCGFCRKDSRYKFAAGYRPFRAWLVSCEHCRKYSRHVLVELVGVRLTKWVGRVR